MVDPSTDAVPDSGPTVASRTCMVVGGLVERAGHALRDRLVAWGRDHGVDGELPAIARAAIAAGEGDRETVQYAPPPGIHWDDTTYTGQAYPCFGWAGCGRCGLVACSPFWPLAAGPVFARRAAGEQPIRPW